MVVETVRALIKLFREEIFENVVLSAGNIVEISKLPILILNGPTVHEKKRLARDPERIVAIDLEENKAIREKLIARDYTVNMYKWTEYGYDQYGFEVVVEITTSAALTVGLNYNVDAFAHFRNTCIEGLSSDAPTSPY